MSEDDALPFDEYAPNDNYDQLAADAWREAITRDVRMLRRWRHHTNNRLLALIADHTRFAAELDARRKQLEMIVDELKKLHDDNVKTAVLLRVIAWLVPLSVASAGILAKFVHGS